MNLFSGSKNLLVASKYNHLFASTHLVDFARHLEELRGVSEAATNSPQGPAAISPWKGPPPTTMTNAGLRMSYSMDENKDGSHVHCLTISNNMGTLPEVVAKCFILYARDLLGLNRSPIRTSRHGHTTYHLVFDIDRAAQKNFVSREIQIPREVDIPQIVSEMNKKNEAISFRERQSL
jgi:hypothetical protein